MKKPSASPGTPRRLWSIASATVVTLALSGLVVVAMTTEGYSTLDAELNDGGIWVTSQEFGSFGRVNKPIGQLDGVLFRDEGTRLDVVQDGATVVGIDLGAGSITPIDPATVASPAGSIARIPSGSSVRLAGATLAVLESDQGRLWAQRTSAVEGEVSVSAVDVESDPVAVLGPGAAMTVTQAGEVFAVTPQEAVLRRFAPDRGIVAEIEEMALEAGPIEPVLTAVGNAPVVLDSADGTLQLPGGVRAEVPLGGVLQQPGPTAEEVLVATTDRVLAVGLDDGATRVVVDESPGGQPVAPVRLGGCVFAAWSGPAASVVTACGGNEAVVSSLGSAADDLVFRVNRNEIILNDQSSGAVWTVDESSPTRLDDWESFQDEAVVVEKKESQDDRDDAGDRSPPRAEPDEFGARIDRATVLHPLDNDTAPEGRLLAITRVEAPRGSDAELTVNPDGQTVQIRLPEDAVTTKFEYYVDDGRATEEAHATVTVTPRPDNLNQAPQLRDNYEPENWKVPAGGTLDLPVLPDWRDDVDGDLLTLDSASVDVDGATARPTSGGRIRVTAPTQPGTLDIEYSVGDGSVDVAPGTVSVEVQSLQDEDAKSATAEADVVSGEVGRPLVIRPLANDLPGSDPVAPDAVIQLAGDVAEVPGAQVSTDLVEGTVTLRSTEPGTYFLDYDVKFANAPFASGLIRVDMRDPVSPPPEPVAVPDSADLYGQAPTLVDVLANDLDPAGGVLVVEAGRAADPQQIEVAVVQGRWLRIAATEGSLRPSPQVVRYTISNGQSGGVRGEVSVTSRPTPDEVDEAAPITDVDRVAVRAGAGVSVPVLDNDYSPLGDELTLLTTVEGGVAGQLTVRRPGDQDGPTGEAYLAGRFVRYVAPPGIRDAQTFTTRYVATDSAGRSAPGRLEITVIPSTRPNREPEPPAIEGRVVAGNVVTLRIPSAGVDPDGDAVTLTGISTPPGLGRVVSYGASSLQYQPFPTSVGTDDFSYTITDAAGASAVGTMRVAVVAPGQSAAPLAVDDSVILEPNRLARIDILGNDLVAEGDKVRARLIDAPTGAVLATPTGPLEVDSPSRIGGRNVEVVYELDNGVATSQATVTVRAASPYNLPPVVFDSFALSEGGEVVDIDLLESAYDPDGNASGLRVSNVFAPPGVSAELVGDSVRVTRGESPLVIPFRVEDADGGAATANLYVPPAQSSVPQLIADASIEIDAGDKRIVDLADYVEDSAGGTVELTLKSRASASPEGEVNVTVVDRTRFSVAATKTYSGPGAVTVEVTTGSGVNDAAGAVALVSIPVQVGSSTPILTCDREPIKIIQGGRAELDVASLCNPYTPDPADAEGLVFTADWETSVKGLSIIEPRGSQITVAAAADAAPGARATLLVTADGSEPGRLQIVVDSAPRPRLTPISVGDLTPGEERQIDIGKFLRSGLPDPEPVVVSVEKLAGPSAQVSAQGSQVSVRVGPRGGGELVLSVVVSDVSPAGGPARRAVGRIEAQVLGRPEAPPAPVPGITQRDGEVALSWKAPEDNGSPITGYDVRGGGASQRCGSTQCEIGGLTNGTPYRFEVRARNAVGVSEWSGLSRAAVPDARPGEVGPIRLVKAGDQQLSIQWSAPKTTTSKVVYQVVWPGGRQSVSGTRALLRGLDNNREYAISVRAINQSGLEGPVRTSAPFQSIGTPGTPKAPNVDEQLTAGDSGAVTLSWAKVDPNGPDPVRYTVLRDGKPLASCAKITRTTCDNGGITYDGSTYQYRVRAVNANGKGLTSPTGGPAPYRAVGTPAAWGPWDLEPKGTNNRGRATFTAPASRGAESVGQILADGVEVKRFGKRGSQFQLFYVDNNDRPFDITLQICNELGRCSPSSTQSLQTYGGLKQSILSVRSNTSGPKVSWTVRIDNNGSPTIADVRLTTCSTGGGAVVCGTDRSSRTLPGPDVNTFTTPEERIGYEMKQMIRVTVRDPNPERGPFSQEKSVNTGRKP